LNTDSTDQDVDPCTNNDGQHSHSGAEFDTYSGHKLQEGDKVHVLDPYDSTPVGIGRIHSLSLLHGVNLNGTGDANVNIIKVTRDILLPYHDKIEGSFLLKEKEGSFTRWSLKYLQKIS